MRRAFLDTWYNGTFCGGFASCCITNMVPLEEDCQAKAPWCNQGRQNQISGTARHTMCPKAHNNQDHRLMHTIVLTGKANNAVIPGDQ